VTDRPPKGNAAPLRVTKIKIRPKVSGDCFSCGVGGGVRLGRISDKTDPRLPSRKRKKQKGLRKRKGQREVHRGERKWRSSRKRARTKEKETLLAEDNESRRRQNRGKRKQLVGFHIMGERAEELKKLGTLLFFKGEPVRLFERTGPARKNRAGVHQEKAAR